LEVHVLTPLLFNKTGTIARQQEVNQQNGLLHYLADLQQSAELILFINHSEQVEGGGMGGRLMLLVQNKK
jgi:hypothetical protein